jgi:hypothetical protein
MKAKRLNAREPEPAPEPVRARASPADALRKRQAAKLAKLDAAIVRWARKQARAHRALAKLEKSRKYYAAKVQS